MINLELYLDHDRLEKTSTKNWCKAQIRDARIIKTIYGLGTQLKASPSNTHRVSVDVLYQLSDQPLRRRQHGGLVVKLAGLQHRQQVCAPQHRVLAHTQQQTLQLSTQLDWLSGKQVTAQWVMLKTSDDARKGTSSRWKMAKRTWF